MNAPSGPQSPKELLEKIQKHVRARYFRREDGFICRTCESAVASVPAAVSVHDADWPHCAGFGSVISVNLPYCPKCEGSPKRVNTCVHINAEEELNILRTAVA